MQRRRLLLVGGGVVAGLGFLGWVRPGDAGQPHDAYFAGLNRLLRAQGGGRPLLVIDRERLLRNCVRLRQSIPAHLGYRVVAKSLPSVGLLREVMAATGTKRLMSFHQPFLNQIARELPDSDVLLGKPMPVAAAATFYRELGSSPFVPAQQLQWLVDTPERLAQYAQLARSLGTSMRINIEIDVGLHRGGVATPADLAPMLELIARHPDQLRFAGFMGYDPHVGKLPALIESRAAGYAKSTAAYRGFQQFVREKYPALWRDDLCFNGAGSPTFRLHTQNPTPLNEVAAGSCLVKPTDFDLDLLSDLESAAFIATPVLKTLPGVQLPGIESVSRYWSIWDPNRQRSYFIYGGKWMAKFASPPGLRDNRIYGASSNQAIVNGSSATALDVDDYVFLRPTQSEAVLLDFGDLAVVEQGRLVAQWPVLQRGGMAL